MCFCCWMTKYFCLFSAPKIWFSFAFVLTKLTGQTRMREFKFGRMIVLAMSSSSLTSFVKARFNLGARSVAIDHTCTWLCDYPPCFCLCVCVCVCVCVCWKSQLRLARWQTNISHPSTAVQIYRPQLIHVAQWQWWSLPRSLLSLPGSGISHSRCFPIKTADVHLRK